MKLPTRIVSGLIYPLIGMIRSAKRIIIKRPSNPWKRRHRLSDIDLSEIDIEPYGNGEVWVTAVANRIGAPDRKVKFGFLSPHSDPAEMCFPNDLYFRLDQEFRKFSPTEPDCE